MTPVELKKLCETGQACPACAARIAISSAVDWRTVDWNEIDQLLKVCFDAELTDNVLKVVHRDLTETRIRLAEDVMRYGIEADMREARRFVVRRYLNRMRGLSVKRRDGTDGFPAYIQVPIVTPQTPVKGNHDDAC